MTSANHSDRNRPDGNQSGANIGGKGSKQNRKANARQSQASNQPGNVEDADKYRPHQDQSGNSQKQGGVDADGNVRLSEQDRRWMQGDDDPQDTGLQATGDEDDDSRLGNLDLEEADEGEDGQEIRADEQSDEDELEEGNPDVLSNPARRKSGYRDGSRTR